MSINCIACGNDHYESFSVEVEYRDHIRICDIYCLDCGRVEKFVQNYPVKEKEEEIILQM